MDLQGADGDDGTNAKIDFTGGSLGLGNKLIIHSIGSATLEKFPGSSSHTIYVDEVTLTGAGSDEQGTLTVADASTIGTLQVSIFGAATISADSTINTFTVDNGGVAVVGADCTIGTFTVDGVVDFTGGSTPSTVTQFLLTGNIEHTGSTVNVNSGADVLVLTSSRIGAINIPGTGKLTLQPRPTPTNENPPRVLELGSLFMGNSPNVPTGKLDIKNNVLIVHYETTSPISEVQRLITSAFNANPRWGISLTSSLGNSNNYGLGYGEAGELLTFNGQGQATYAGVTVDQTTVLVKYTFYGDADLNGTVNLTDFNVLAGHFGLSPSRWTQGDFNYDANINLVDFNLLAANFGSTGLGPDEGSVDEVTPEELAELWSKMTGG